MNCLCFYFYS